VLIRKLGYIELCFNQNQHFDAYFSDSRAQQWQLFEVGECFQCENHKYTCIFYDPKTSYSRPFQQIYDPKVKIFLKENLNLRLEDCPF